MEAYQAMVSLNIQHLVRIPVDPQEPFPRTPKKKFTKSNCSKIRFQTVKVGLRTWKKLSEQFLKKPRLKGINNLRHLLKRSSYLGAPKRCAAAFKKRQKKSKDLLKNHLLTWMLKKSELGSELSGERSDLWPRQYMRKLFKILFLNLDIR
jgi:hypothetical protein